MPINGGSIGNFKAAIYGHNLTINKEDFIMKISGFITNLGKYNEGELVGEWIEFPISEDELNGVFARIGINYINDDVEEVNTGYEEYFFTDWECDMEVSISSLGEYINIDKINETAENLRAWDDDLLGAVIEAFGFDEVMDSNPDDYMLLPCDTYDELGEYYVENFYPELLENMGNLSYYFDYTSYGRDIDIEECGDFTEYGYIVRI